MIDTQKSPQESSPGSPATDRSPPPYAQSDPASSSSKPPPVSPDDLKPSNYVLLDPKDRSVQGTYLLDPSLEVPDEFLAPLPDGQSKKHRCNFRALSTHGNVSTILYLLDKPILKIDGWIHREKVLINTSSTHGAVSTCIRRERSLPAFDLKAESRNGSVVVKIPHTYRGMITGTTKHGRV
ncbi:hypothetical protein GYMLUDRAFT_42868 [Collybiopsis luxurians FD-317 M1]|uniref:DUF7330 domain-containing protein n=1 Tax=Collybiopsis luxurians FD-317 M1 TaxID=944289 RepID=A0A0D0BZF7_9AGAR|nr:hypothetical protein GYMLUDRAFT_42868 [Collybiopsis luxurians FD-317 M1]